MSRVRDIAQIGIPFAWFGMVVAISLIEAPLKFRAPGITTALGLGIGRLVFRALNLAELALLAGLTISMVATALAGTGSAAALGAPRWGMLGVLWVVLLTQAAVLRPILDRRAQIIIDGGTPPPSHLHLVYIGLEAAKLIILLALGISLAARLLR